jgi:hypothetical protein
VKKVDHEVRLQLVRDHEVRVGSTEASSASHSACALAAS